MKKFLVIVLILIVVLIGAIVAIPFLFKDEIKAAVDKEIENNVRAEVYFNPEKFDLSIIKNFPNITLILEDFGVVGIEEFEGDTLAAIDAFEITLDLKSVFSGEQISVKAINLVNPRIFVMVLPDGRANYDIAVESDEVETADESDTGSSEISVGIDAWNIVNGKVVYYDLSMNFLMALDGINHNGSGDFTLDVFDLSTSTVIERMMVNYDNVEYLKDKRLEANITLAMDMANSTYSFKENKISLNDLSFGFDGNIAMPGDDIVMDISFEGIDNSIKSLFSLVPGVFKEGYDNIKADGNLSIKGYVKGTMSENPASMPAYNIEIVAANGMIQYPELPESLRNINLSLVVDNNDGIIDNTVIDMKSFHVDFGNNPFDATLKVKNLVDYDMEASINARIDLEDMLKLFPMEDTQMKGIINGEVNIKGVYDSINNTIPASGNLAIENLHYISDLLPQGFGIQKSSVEITTDRINVNSFSGNAGRTDLNMNGYLSNYLNYVMKEEEVLEGKLNFASSMVDLNEWMTDTEEGEDSTEDTTALEVIEVPRNIDFELQSDIKSVLYDNLTLENVKGLIIIRDGAVKMEDVAFRTLDGSFNIAGEYNTRDIDHPKFDFALDIKDLSIPKAYDNFISLQQFAPIAKLMDGKFNTNFSLNGELGKDLMPNLSTLSGKGLLNILQASIKGADSKVISGITTLTKLTGDNTNVTLSNVLMNAEISEGRVYTEPFNVKFGKNNALIAGSSGIDGSLDYKVKLDVPQEAVKTASSLVSSLTGQNLKVDAQNVKLNLGVIGNYDNPDIKILGAETGGTSQAAKQELKATMEAEKEKLQAEAEQKLAEEQKKAEEEVEKVVDEQKEVIEKEVDKAKDKLNDFFKKKKGGG